MNKTDEDSGRQVADIIHQRVGAGESDMVAGWQQMLTDLLGKMGPYLKAGQLVTFRTLLPEEKTFFQSLHQDIAVPGHITALYISPSVRHQMMYGNRDSVETETAIDSTVEGPPDAGIVLACRENDHRIIVNVLFAHPPHTPAIDVYDQGRLIAGYSYASLTACRDEISAVLQRHLTSP